MKERGNQTGRGHVSKGKVVQVIGPVVDAEFTKGELPAIYNAIRVDAPAIKISACRPCLGRYQRITNLPASGALNLSR